MADIDLEAIYNQSKKVGLLDTPAKKSEAIDLEAVYEKSKKGIIDAPMKPAEQPLATKQTGIDYMASARKAGQAVMNPTPPQMAMGGLDPVQRGLQTLGNDIYSQGRGAIQSMVPDRVKQLMGQGAASMLPGGMMTANAIDPRIKQMAGNEGVGLGVDVLSGLGVAGAEKIKAGIASKLPRIQFGNEKSYRKLAESIRNDMSAVDGTFQADYDTIMKKAGDKMVSQDLKDSLVETASAGLSKTNDEKILNRFMDAMNQENLNVTTLHNMKAEVYGAMRGSKGGTRSALSDIYNKINEVISSRELAGKQYGAVTDRYNFYKKKVENYLNKLTLDPGTKNLSEAPLMAKRKLTVNQKDALLALSNLAKSKNLSPEILSMIRGSNLTKVLEQYGPRIAVGAAVGAGGLAAAGWGVGRLLRSND